MFCWLIQKLNPPHKRNNAIKPAKKDARGFCAIINDTTAAAIAIVHQGKNKLLAKLKRAINIMDTKNFMYV